jgi:glycosyltransferase involved in cell wall biosynthesis
MHLVRYSAVAATPDNDALAAACGAPALEDLDRPAAVERPTVAFVMEQHLGHRTYYENVRAHVDDSRFTPVWILVDYSIGRSLARFPIPRQVKAAAAARRSIRRGIRSSAADAHVFNTQVPAALGGRVARSKPYVVITDVTPAQYDRMADGYGHRADRSGPLAWAKHRINRRTFSEAQWCVGWSQWVCDSLVGDYGVAPERTRVIPPGVDTTVWAPGPVVDEARLRLLFVGGDFERKGGQDLLRAFPSLPDDAELVIVTRSAVPGSARVTVINDLTPNDPRLVELYRTANLFVLPTRAETFGIAAAEAAACGLPVVASDVGGMADIVEDGTTGFLMPMEDRAALARALRTLQENPELRRSMGAAGRERAVQRFDAATNGRALTALVAGALDWD